MDCVVGEVALGPRHYFQFVKDSAASIDLVLGDGRLSLEREAARCNLQRFDILAADAFSADAVPAHFLTREAMGIYLQHVRRGGVLAFNISNRFLDLAPVIAGLAKAFRLNAVQVRDQYSIWILLSQDSEIFRTPDLERRPTSVALPREPVPSSPNYITLFAVLRRQQLALR